MMRLGMIGMSEGNGHPYSWSAICNGYDRKEMLKCPFPGIPNYLSRQVFPRDRLKGVQVTHLWTQRRQDSERIAKAALIPETVSKPTDMIGKIDALLLARDDAENHENFAKPFLKSGIPVYIDKPVALSIRQWRRLCALQKYPSQIFTCSALRYASELMVSRGELQRLGRLIRVSAVVPKSWERYAVHGIEPLVVSLPGKMKIETVETRNGSVLASYRHARGFCVEVIATGGAGAPIQLEWVGSKGVLTKTFSDSFSAFKRAISEFVFQVKRENLRIPRKQTEQVISMIEMGIG